MIRTGLVQLHPPTFDATSLLATYGVRLAAPRIWPDLLWRLPPLSGHDRVVYLTFDDGPTQHTPRLLDTLARYDARATFFLLGRQMDQHPHTVDLLLDAGHTLGNHGYTHPDPWRTPTAVLLAEFERTAQRLTGHIGQPPRWLRPPYGHFTRVLRAWGLSRRQRMVMWDVMPGDFLRGVTSRQITQRVLRTVRPGSIVVLHDNPNVAEVTPPALAALLSDLSADGWRFAAL
ncbi:MAG: polysaccharide deacetylase family protein [Bacteroidota bacterium]